MKHFYIFSPYFDNVLCSQVMIEIERKRKKRMQEAKKIEGKNKSRGYLKKKGRSRKKKKGEE